MENTFTFEGHTFGYELDFEFTVEAPWEQCDGHGPVSDWTMRSKHPGELVLCNDRGSKRYYDFQAAIEQAKKEGWDSWPYDKSLTKGQRAYKAVMLDFEYLQAWCEDEWYYAVLKVVLLDEDEDETEYDQCLGGIESGYWIDHQARKRGEEPYYLEAARELASEILYQYRKDHHWETVQNLGVAA
jgi:hypothetical protein